ncbi:MAG: SMC-Scp complex subunit ScpB [Candidatus Sumerlaeaceae bacterium]|nr:SMC-Scp complex subunit ScpB [Candidatus Sumerlaeaceae bacterium]
MSQTKAKSKKKEDGTPEVEEAIETQESPEAEIPPDENAQIDTIEGSEQDLPTRTREQGESFQLVHLLEFVPTQKRRKADANAEDEADPSLHIHSVAEARAIVESFLFATNEPLSAERLGKLMNNLHPRTVRGLLLELQMEYDKRGGGMQILEVAGGFQMASRPQYSEWLYRLHKQRRRNALSNATLETLAIVAYKQPITKAEMESIRGVECSGALRTLQEAGLIDVGGRREVAGRPQLYVTTEEFLKTFGLRALGDLASVQELKQLFPNPVVRKLNEDESPKTQPEETEILDPTVDTQLEISDGVASDNPETVIASKDEEVPDLEAENAPTEN